MKQKILEALKTKFGVEDKIVDRIASKGAKTVTTDEEVATFVEGVTFQQIADSYADSRATDATKNAVSNYEKKHNLRDGKPAKAEPEPKSEPETNPDADVPAWVKQLMESNKALQERMDKLDGEKTANSRKAQLNEVLKDAPEKIKSMYERNFSRYNFKDDDDFAAFLEEAKGDATAIANDIKSSQGKMTPPKGGGGGVSDKPSAAIVARIEAQKASAENTPSAIRG